MTSRTAAKKLTAKKRAVSQEPLLNTVARKLGRAAGTLTKVTQELTENLSTFPDSVAMKVREAAHVTTPARRSRVRARHSKKRLSRTDSTDRRIKSNAHPKKRQASKDASRPVKQKRASATG